jgi:hypothetical protein
MNGRLTTITQSLYYVSVNGKKNICRHLYLLKSVCLNSYGFYIQLCHDDRENKLIINEMMMRSALF